MVEPPSSSEIPDRGNKKESHFLLDPLVPWDCSSIGQSTALSRRKLRVRAPSVPTNRISTPIRRSSFSERGALGQHVIPKGIRFGVLVTSTRTDWLEKDKCRLVQWLVGSIILRVSIPRDTESSFWIDPHSCKETKSDLFLGRISTDGIRFLYNTNWI